MRIKNNLVALIVFFGLTSLAFAAGKDDTYAGANYAFMTYDEEGFGAYHANVLIVKFGKYQTDSFAIEGRIGSGMGSETKGGITVEIDSLIGFYALGYMSKGDVASTYGFFGLTKVDVSASNNANGRSAEDSDSSVSYGLGTNFNIDKSKSINLEVGSYYKKQQTNIYGVSLGFSVVY